MTIEQAELSRRAGKVFSVIEYQTRIKILDEISNAKSFETLSKETQTIIENAESELKKNYYKRF